MTSHAVIEGSALLKLRGLRVLRAEGWHICFMSEAAISGRSRAAELALSELNASAWRPMYHEVLLDAALRGGNVIRSCAGLRISQLGDDGIVFFSTLYSQRLLPNNF